MINLSFIGNLTADPQQRTTQSGKTVTSFTVAVNGRDRDDVTFIRVSAWEKLGETCAKYLAKGRKVFISGTPRASAYTANGEARASLECSAREVEFLSASQQRSDADDSGLSAPKTGAAIPADVAAEDLPFD